MDREYCLAYSKGYNAGSRGAWPEHKPPLPPCLLVSGIIEASRKLRDEADAQCAVLCEDDDLVRELGPLIDDYDVVMSQLSYWLREIKQEQGK